MNVTEQTANEAIAEAETSLKRYFYIKFIYRF